MQSRRGFSILTLAGFKLTKQRHSKYLSRWSCGYLHRGCKAVTSAHSNQIVATYPWVQLLTIQYFNKQKTDFDFPRTILEVETASYPLLLLHATLKRSVDVWYVSTDQRTRHEGKVKRCAVRAPERWRLVFHSFIRARPY